MLRQNIASVHILHNMAASTGTFQKRINKNTVQPLMRNHNKMSKFSHNEDPDNNKGVARATAITRLFLRKQPR